MKNWLKRMLQGIIIAMRTILQGVVGVVTSFVHNIRSTTYTYHFYAAMRHEYKAFVAYKPAGVGERDLRDARRLLAKMKEQEFCFEEDAYNRTTQILIALLIGAVLVIPVGWGFSQLIDNNSVWFPIATGIVTAVGAVALGVFVARKTGDMLTSYRIKKLQNWINGANPSTVRAIAKART